MATTPFIHDVPGAEALAAWRSACAAAGCPERVEAVRLGLHEAVGRVTAEPVWATRSSPSFDASAMDGIATPLFGASALLSILGDADGYVVVPDDATGLPAGTEVDVTLYT